MAAGRATPPLLKDLNERTVLEAIRERGADLAGRDLAAGRDLEADGLAGAAVAARRRARARGGAAPATARATAPIFFEPVPEAALVLGLDLGARFVRGAVCDLRGEIRARQDVELPERDGRRGARGDRRAARVAARGGRRVDAARRRRRRRRPGRRRRPHERASRSRRTSRGSRATASRAELAARLGLPVTIENDINLAALGEQWRGIARGVDDFVVPLDRHRPRRRDRAARRAPPRPQRRRPASSTTRASA